MALKFKMNPWGARDIKRLRKASALREKRIQATGDSPLPTNYKSNVQAASLHPERQRAVIKEIVEEGDVRIFVLHTKDNRPLAYFRAGQCVGVPLQIGNVFTTHCYSLASSPKRALEGECEIAVKRVKGGAASAAIFSAWKVGNEIAFSAPQGNFFYEPLRDERKVVALAGGCGVAPFIAMAEAIADGTEDFELTILYGARRKADIIYRKKLDQMARSCSKIHVSYVLSEEERPFYERGLLTAETIKKNAGDGPVSYFACGPQPMYDFLEGEMRRLQVDLRHYRQEIFGAPIDVTLQSGYPSLSKGLVFKMTVHVSDQAFEIPANASESILAAVERYGLKVPSLCRGGVCGWCRSKLIKGQVYVPWRCDGRRASDIAFHYIHPCTTYPLSDLEIELPAASLY